MSESQPSPETGQFVTERRHDAMYEKVYKRIDELEKKVEEQEETIDQHEETIQSLTADLDGHRTGKYGKYCEVIENAANRRDPNQDEVACDRANVKGATGCSDKHAYNIMEQMDERFTFATLKEQEQITGRPNKPKRVMIDFDGREKEKLIEIVHKVAGSTDEAQR